jgi:Mce-associated membrane protein
VAVLALGVIGAAYEGWLLFAHHQREVAAAQALDAAQKYTTVLTGVDPAAIDKNFAEVLDGATGEFKDMYAASSEQLRQLLIDNKAAAHGTVIEAAVKSAAKNQVEVLLFVDQSVSNKASPQARIDRSRIVMTMEKVNGRWLAAKVDMP